VSSVVQEFMGAVTVDDALELWLGKGHIALRLEIT
jgi:hypothetical protein